MVRANWSQEEGWERAETESGEQEPLRQCPPVRWHLVSLLAVGWLVGFTSCCSGLKHGGGFMEGLLPGPPGRPCFRLHD